MRYFNITKFEESAWIGYYRNGMTFYEISVLVDASALLIRKVIENYITSKKRNKI